MMPKMAPVTSTSDLPLGEEVSVELVAADPKTRTVEFRLSKPNPVFLQNMDAVFIMSRAWSDKHKVTKPLDFKNKEESYAGFNANGTGPYMLVSRQPGIKTVLKRNPAWWGWKDEKRWLEALFASGELMVARRDAFQRVYDLAHRVVPGLAELPLPHADLVHDHFIEQAITALGVTQARWVHDYFRMKPRLKDADLDALARTVQAMSMLACAEVVEEAEINPLLVADGRIEALDALATWR